MPILWALDMHMMAIIDSLDVTMDDNVYFKKQACEHIKLTLTL